MPTLVRPVLSGALLLSAAAIAACADATAPGSPLVPTGISRQGGSGGGGGGGFVPPSNQVGGVTIQPYDPLRTSPVPTSAPAPDILMRESFGSNGGYRPASGNGDLRGIAAGFTTLKSFWLEYPGSKNTQWIAPDVGQVWHFGGEGTSEPNNPFQLPSTYQIGSAWSQSPTFPTSFPTALMPITVALPGGGYEYSMEGWPETTPGAYIAIGFTNSAALASNLTSSGSVWVKVTDPSGLGVPLHYELRSGSLAGGKLLAEGDGGSRGYNHMAIRVSPAAGTVTLNFGTVFHSDAFDFADTTSVTAPLTIPQPKYLAFEGIGIVSNLVLRK